MYETLSGFDTRLTDYHESRSTFHSSRKAPPVGKHYKWKALSVQVLDGLSGFESRIWEPHLSCLLDDLNIQNQKVSISPWASVNV